MFDFKTTLSTAGLLMTALGAWLVLHYSPVNEWNVDGGTPLTPASKTLAADTARKNRGIKAGAWVVLVETILQAVTNYVPAGK